MVWVITVLQFLLCVAIYLNIVASISVYKSKTLEPFQKYAQSLIIWLVPLLGSWFVINMLSEQEVESIPKKWISPQFRGWFNIPGTNHERLHGKENESMNDGGSYSGGDGGE
jgi:hypothetical protein